MKKIAIIGTENSHASAFARLLQGRDDVSIIGAYGTEAEANKKFHENFGIDCSATSPADFAGNVDGIMITSRKGSTHFESALPYLTEGMTVFIDKPITISTLEASKIGEVSEKNNVKLCGGSCLKYAPALKSLSKTILQTNEKVCAAQFCAPVEMESPHDGFFFYAQHLVEMCLAIFGNNVKSVFAIRNNEKLAAVLNYGSFCATLSFGCNIYTASITFENFEKHTEIKNVIRLYGNELSYFLSLLRGKELKYSAKDVIYPVFVLDAIYRSYNEGCEITLSV
jgi:predicted dehydrogenase